MPGMVPNPTLIRLRPRAEDLYIGRGRLTLSTGRDGFLHEGGAHGLFAYETRVLSRYRYRIDGSAPAPVALSAVTPHTWLGYYVCLPPGAEVGPADEGSGMMAPSSEHSLELRLSRTIGAAVREDARLTNFSRQRTRFELALAVDADFADLQEVQGERRQQGRLRRTWQGGAHGGRLVFDYEATSPGGPKGGPGGARLHRWLVVEVRGADSPPAWRDGSLRFDVTLEPGASWSVRVDWIVGGDDLPDPVHAVDEALHDRDRRTRRFLDAAASFSVPGADSLAPVVAGALERAREDLAALRLFDLDEDETAWTMAAGLPIYTAFYGRDTLTAGWQAALLGPEMMRGTLSTLTRLQGTVRDDWRDEAPGRMIHEAHPGPLKVLGYNPFGRYFGSITTSAFFPVVVSELWHWTGDAAQVRPFLQPALTALRWLDTQAAADGRGFYAYRSRSAQGVTHQAWKDSPGAIVDDEGRPVEPPIATCEEQGFVYLAKLHLSEVLWALGERAEAKRLYREARALQQRFNEAFWMDDQGFYALGLDAAGRPIRAVASNPGHCLATAIVDPGRAETVARRLFEDDLFSGWGIRTLSTANPAYNPYSYHRGSVWPVEQGTFALAFMRYGLHDLVERLAKAQFEAAALFDHYRLPEVFSGHARTAEQPFPALYPQANAPQAWSASALFSLVQAMLGLYPYAPLRVLLVDPHLPAWLPELTLRGLRVGAARATIRFYRKADGSTGYHVEDVDGPLHVLQQPSPWSLTAGPWERFTDALASLLPGR